MGGGVSRLRRAAKKIGFQCACSSENSEQDSRKNISTSGGISSMAVKEESEIAEGVAVSNLTKQGLCAICLESLSCGGEDSQAIFTAQCMHSFHFLCIASNVRHGSVTCPICRAQWSQLPRDLTAPRQFPCPPQTDPVLRILDDSIATFRVHRRSSLRSARYDDDDPIEPDPTPPHPRLQLELITIPILTEPSMSNHLPGVSPCGHSPLSHHQILPDVSPCGNSPLSHHQILPGVSPCGHTTLSHHQITGCSMSAISLDGQSRAYLSVRLSHQQATDIILVASPNGPHLRLLKQSMALVVFLLRPVDRLAIVTYSSAATRAFPLRRMTAHGKRTALQVIDRLFYLGEADQVEGLKKGVKILEDRTHQNPLCCILHLSDSPTRAYTSRDLQVPIQIHHFHVGFGFGMSNGFVMHEFEEFLSRLLGGVIRETQLKIGEEGGLIRLGELRCGEERRIPIDRAGDCGFVCVGYSYIEGGIEDCLRTGEVVVGIGEKCERRIDGGVDAGGRDLSMGRNSSVGRWDYLDPFMARRWAKHLHGYRA